MPAPLLLVVVLFLAVLAVDLVPLILLEVIDWLKGRRLDRSLPPQSVRGGRPFMPNDRRTL